jgi:hypothetical protein
MSLQRKEQKIQLIADFKMIKEFEKENEVKIKIQKSIQQRLRKTWNDPKDNKKEENKQYEDNVKIKLFEDHNSDKDINDNRKCSDKAFEDKGDNSEDPDRDINDPRGVPEDIAATKINAEVSRGDDDRDISDPKGDDDRDISDPIAVPENFAESMEGMEYYKGDDDKDISDPKGDDDRDISDPIAVPQGNAGPNGFNREDDKGDNTMEDLQDSMCVIQ